MSETTLQSTPHLADDVCALPLARRLAAMLDRDPFALRDGDPLPHGWHVLLFNAPTPQSQLRADGAAGLGVRLPDIGLPRLMMGGRQCQFTGDIPIGARVRRETRQGEVQLKQGRSGRFALVKVEHRVFVEGRQAPSLIENTDYVLREAIVPEASPASPTPAASPPSDPGVRALVPNAIRTLIPDSRLLFRYSAITDNPHRIHYDQPYARDAEGYPALVVNGSIPSMFLLELFRSAAGREPATFTSRNVAPMFSERPLQLKALDEGTSWHLWAEDEQGHTCFDAHAT
jgi:3-methylfumaryl-CoA hydratase